MQLVPLRIRIELEENTPAGRIMFSQGILRPTIENCDKTVLLREKDVFAVYSSNRENEKFFIEEHIYIGIEVNRDAKLTFQCTFGKGRILYYNYINYSWIQSKN